MRTFIAIDLPDGMKSGLGRYVRDISGGKRDYKWVAVENLHVTMAFLGDIEYDDITVVASAIGRAASEGSPFTARLGAVGTFPSVIWIGLSQGDGECQEIYKHLCREMGEAGFRLDDKRYHPHITIARSRRRMSPEVRRYFETNEPPRSPSFRINELVLFESRLRPQGPEYIPLQRISLGEEK